MDPEAPSSPKPPSLAILQEKVQAECWPGDRCKGKKKISLQLLLLLAASLTHTEGWLKPSIPGPISPNSQTSFAANAAPDSFSSQSKRVPAAIPKAPQSCDAALPYLTSNHSAWSRDAGRYSGGKVLSSCLSKKSTFQILYASLLTRGIFFC